MSDEFFKLASKYSKNKENVHTDQIVEFLQKYDIEKLSKIKIIINTFLIQRNLSTKTIKYTNICNLIDEVIKKKEEEKLYDLFSFF